MNTRTGLPIGLTTFVGMGPVPPVPQVIHAGMMGMSSLREDHGVGRSRANVDVTEREEIHVTVGIADHPGARPVVPEFDQPFLRELIHPPFQIVYRRDRKSVRIVRVWRSEHLLRLP